LNTKLKRPVVLVAALSFIALICLLDYAVTSSGRSGHDRADVETSAIAAAELTQFESMVRKNIEHMLEDGVKIEDLDFRFPEENTPLSEFSVFKVYNKIILPSGYVPSTIYDRENHYIFTDKNRISSLGTDAPEVIAIAWPIKEDVCKSINRGIGGKDFMDWAESHSKKSTRPNANL